MDRRDITALFARADAWNRHDAVTLAADHAEDAVAESPLLGHIEGRANIQALYETWFASFQDLVYVAKELVIDGDEAAQFFTIRATQSPRLRAFRPPAAARIQRRGPVRLARTDSSVTTSGCTTSRPSWSNWAC